MQVDDPRENGSYEDVSVRITGKDKTLTLRELLGLCRDLTPELRTEFETRRQQAFKLCSRIYNDRVDSYNADHLSVEEMAFGPISLASELHKRSIRMCGLLSPLKTSDLSDRDLSRLLDLCLDLINYASWQFGILTTAVTRKAATDGKPEDRDDSTHSTSSPSGR